MATAQGMDADQAIHDAMTFQHVVKAVPVGVCAPPEPPKSMLSSFGAMLRGAKR
jgi:hypothetical protein